MTEVRAGDLRPGDTLAEWGMEPVTVGAVGAHGDTVLVTGLAGEAIAIDHDTTVELLRRTRPRTA